MMWGWVAKIFEGIVTGIVGPLASAYEKKQDVTLAGAQAGMTADVANNKAWLDYNLSIQTLKLQAMQWWGPRALYMIVGFAATYHCAAIFLDSSPIGVPYLWTHEIGSWRVAKLPAPYDSYEGWVVASLFVTSVVKGPVSALTSWFAKK